MDGLSPRSNDRPSGTPGLRPDFREQLAEAVSAFGATVREPLAAGLGNPENQIGSAAALLVKEVGRALGLRVITHAEVPLSELSTRPDFAVHVADGAVGFIEVKRPGKGANPTVWSTRSHDGRQWKNLQLLPNVLYTDGTEWALYRYGQRVGQIARLSGPLDRAGRSLRAVGDGLAMVLEEFLWQSPSPPLNLRSLVKATARLCRYLREEVIEVLKYEHTAPLESRPFTALAQEWRDLLFPRMTEDARFADAYAQTITFSLLLARNAGVVFEGRDLPAIGRQLGKQYALIGRALSVLSDPLAAENLLIIETLRRVIGAVDWDQLDVTTADARATLYETFLQEYDPELRRLSGSYYTPDRLARSMVRLTDQILREKMNRLWGYANDDVIVVDPAMGTGTFLVEIVDQVAQTVAAHQGDGANAQRLRELFRRRLIGFERQVTPYSVAELRLHEALRTRYHVDVPEQEMRFLADTFEDPYKQELTFGRMYDELRKQREGANRVKRDVPVMVIIGNPPYLDRAHQRDPAPWIEDRREQNKPIDVVCRPSLDEFRQHGRLDYKLSATWVFYWRWAIWKAFEAHPDHPAGIVAFITPSSYLTGDAFAKMRSYLRQIADEAWLINVSPEHHQPPVDSRLFPGVQQPLCIAVFARYGKGKENVPARVHYIAISGSGEEKLRALHELDIHDEGWQDAPSGQKSAFIPSGDADWNLYPSLGDIFPWHSPGVKANRTWVIAPDPGVLQRRWETLIDSDLGQKNLLLKATPDRDVDSLVAPILGEGPQSPSVRNEKDRHPLLAPYSFRSFDRQYIIRDARVIDRPRRDLWAVEGPRQVYVIEPHTNAIDDGPGVTLSATAPDMHYFQGHHGGRTMPLYRDKAATIPNVAPGLIRHLEKRLSGKITAEDLLAYVTALVAHPGYTRRFKDSLTVPGIRVPLSADYGLWGQAIPLGLEAISLHTLPGRYPESSDPSRHQNSGADTPKIISSIPYAELDMPNSVRYDAGNKILCIGETGRVWPVPASVWEYQVGGMRVVDKWINYRLKRPRRRSSSSLLDTINASCWPQHFNDDLLELLRIIDRLVQLQPKQDALLREICDGPLLDTDWLCQAGVLPVEASAKGPMHLVLESGQLAT